MTGIPFMGPWANRLDEQAFYANGKRYPFDMSARQRARRHSDPRLPDHDVEWRVVSMDAGRGGPVTSRLEFFRQPAWMKQWPFAHTIEMTYRLQNGTLEVETAITNLSAEPMPVAIGFHPYFQLTDSPRDEWTIAVGARTHWLLTANKLPTGETEPIGGRSHRRRAAARPQPGRRVQRSEPRRAGPRDDDGHAASTAPRRQFGPNYRSAVVWAPKPQNFICFEPMAAITNAINMAHKGIYKELQRSRPAACGARASGSRRAGSYPAEAGHYIRKSACRWKWCFPSLPP